MKNILLLAFLIIMVFVSCNADKKQSADQFKTDRKKIIDSLVSKYKITYNLDSLDVKLWDSYSINYKPMIESNYQLIDDITISDIYEKDSLEFVSIKTGYYPAFYFDFPISKEQEKILLRKDDDLIFVVSISQVRKIKLSIQGEVENDGVSVNIGSSTDFIGKGKIIDIVSIKKQTTE